MTLADSARPHKNLPSGPSRDSFGAMRSALLSDTLEIALAGVDHRIEHPVDLCVEEIARGFFALESRRADGSATAAPPARRSARGE
jgi:hypothetical protein